MGVGFVERHANHVQRQTRIGHGLKTGFGRWSVAKDECGEARSAHLAHQPVGAASAGAHAVVCAGIRRIGGHSTRHHQTVEGFVVDGVQLRVAQRGGHRQATAVDHLASKRMLTRQVQHGIAEHAAHLALGRDEIGGAGRVENVLVGGHFAFTGIAVEQRFGGFALVHRSDLPGEVFRILQAGVGTTGTEGRHAVCGVSGEQHAAVAEGVHAQAGKGVDAGPLEGEFGVLERRGVQHGAHARDDVLGLALLVRIGVPAELEVDAPHTVRLHVQQHALVAVKVGVEPEPALGRKVHVHFHVGNQEAVAEHAALAFLAQQLAQCGARAVAGRHPVAAHLVVAIGRFDGQQCVIGMLLDTDHLVVPADVDQRQLRRTLGQKTFYIILLQVHEGRALMAFFGLQVEFINLLGLQEYTSEFPRHALAGHAVAAAQAVEDFQRALGKANGAGARRQLVVVVEQHHGDALLRQIDRQRQPHRTRAHHHHRMASGLSCPLIRMARVLEGHLLKVQLLTRWRRQIIEFHRMSPWILEGSFFLSVLLSGCGSGRLLLGRALIPASV